MKEDTKKIYLQKSNQVMEYINANLHAPIKLEIIAKHINVSKRQLLRIINLHLNEPLYAYTRRLRMERAVMYMQIEMMGLTKLAYMVGYENPQSFSKAFKKQFNISPKLYMMRLYNRLKEYTKHSSIIVNSIKPEEVYIDTNLHLVCVRITGKYGDDEPYKKGWNGLIDFLNKRNLLNESNRFIGISMDDPKVTKTENCRFYACASVNDNSVVVNGEFRTLYIPKGKYAIYTLKGSYSQLQDLYNNITLNLNSKVRHGITFEEYLNSPTNTIENELVTKVYIPIK